MAIRAPKICPCGRKVGAGASCQCLRNRMRARPSSASLGYGSTWRREAKAWLALPGNEKCACGAAADRVGHRVAFKGNAQRQWDQKNWMPSCIRCNARQAAKHEGGFGNPVKAIRCD